VNTTRFKNKTETLLFAHWK